MLHLNPSLLKNGSFPMAGIMIYVTLNQRKKHIKRKIPSRVKLFMLVGVFYCAIHTNATLD